MNSIRKKVGIGVVIVFLAFLFTTLYAGNSATGEAQVKLQLAVKYVHDKEFKMAALAYGEGIKIAYRQMFDRITGKNRSMAVDSGQISLESTGGKNAVKVTSGVTVAKYKQDQNEGIRISLNPALLEPAELRNQIKYYKCDMFQDPNQIFDLDRLQKEADSSCGTNLTPIKATSFNMTSNQGTFTNPGGLVVFLDENKKVVAYYYSQAE